MPSIVNYNKVHSDGLVHVFGLDFLVGPEVFIPKESGIYIIQQADIHIKKNGGELKVADFGAGTGFISISLKRSNPNINVTAIEKSPEAYAYLLQNIEKHGYDITALNLDVADNTINNFDLIIANPPYYPNSKTFNMKDPDMSLYGGETGLETINLFIDNAAKSLKSGGTYMFSHLISQTYDVTLKLGEFFMDIQTTNHPRMNPKEPSAQAITIATRQ